MEGASYSIAFAEPDRCIEALQEEILRLLGKQTVPLEHGETFTGRPGTQIRCDDRRVLKLREDQHFDRGLAVRWVRYLEDRERRFGVAHPDKIWFAFGRDDRWALANLSPRLSPLHVQLEEMGDIRDRLSALEKVLEMTVTLAVRHGYGLDEGLSNFGLDPQDRIYYLDDEYYRWTGFLTLIQALRLWFSSFPWLDAVSSARLGGSFRSLLVDHFDDRHILRTVAAELRNVHLPDDACRARFGSFVDAVEQGLSPTGIKARSSGTPRNRRFAVLADVHANLSALEAVLEDMSTNGIEDAVVLGDVVGYGPQPAECIDVLRRRRFSVIKGNHDHGIANANFEKGFSSYARWVAEWTHAHLDDVARSWLDELPLYIEGPGWLGVHGSPCDRYYFYGYVYQSTYEKNLEALKERNLPLCFHGHTHMPGIYYANGTDCGFANLETRTSLDGYDASLVCPGSVGQPRDGTIESQYLIFDPDAMSLEYRRVPYDVPRTVAAMRGHDFPTPLIDRLEAGR